METATQTFRVTLTDGTRHAVDGKNQKRAMQKFVATFKKAWKPNPEVKTIEIKGKDGSYGLVWKKS